MAKCCFCRDDIENHTGNLRYPDGSINRWLCGTCVKYAIITDYLQVQAEIRRAAAKEAQEVELKEVARRAEELEKNACVPCLSCRGTNQHHKAGCSLLTEGAKVE